MTVSCTRFSVNRVSRGFAPRRRDQDGDCARREASQERVGTASGERAMIKVKRLRTADCVVGGFRYESHSREVGSLLLGLYTADGRLDHVGFTSTIPKSERPALTRRLEALRAPPGFTGKAPGGPSRWSTERSGEWEALRPELVVEVQFDHVTGDRFRHGGGDPISWCMSCTARWRHCACSHPASSTNTSVTSPTPAWRKPCRT